MSWDDGWAAVHLEMPPRIPRIEADAQVNWNLVRAVTGIEVYPHSDPETRADASAAFMRAWNYDLTLGAVIHCSEFGDHRSFMGHAEYADGAVDRDDRLGNLFADCEDALAFDPWVAYGEKDHDDIVQRFNDHYAQLRTAHPELVPTTGIYISLITGLTYILGWDMLLECAGLEPERFGELVGRYRTWIQQYYNALAASDAPVVYCHDDIVWTSGAVFRPEWYRKFVFPNLKRLFQPLVDAGKKVLWICDGNYTEFIDDVIDLGVSGFFFEPLTSLAELVEKCGQTHILIGNVNTHALLSGTKADIRAEVQRCVDLGRDCPGYFMCVSNMIPANTPVENALYYNEVYEELATRRG